MRLSGYRSQARWLRSLLLPAVCVLVAGVGTFAIDRHLLLQKKGRRPPGGEAQPHWSAAPRSVGAAAGSWPATAADFDASLSKRIAKYAAAFEKYGKDFKDAPLLPKGEFAPDFRLPTALGDRQVHLAAFRRRKPVVLLFGSFGCDVFCADLPRLEAMMSQGHKNAAEFLLVYISEGPHRLLPPLDATAPESRPAYVQRGLQHFGVTMPCVLDGPDYAVEDAYDSFPRRLMVVDGAGRIALDLGKGLHGPWDLKALERWLMTQAAPVRGGS